MARERQNNNALQIIFSFFLGLMVLAFIGIGVNTFYPSPMNEYSEELQDLYREQERLSMKQGGIVTPAEEAELESVQNEIDELNEKQEAEQKIWARNTSIVLILFATIVMSISLIRSEQLRVISNGLLLGGLFTMIYGVGWVIFSGESTARFIVIVFAFAVTLALGYLKFVRGRESGELMVSAVAAGPAGTVAGGDAQTLSALEARIQALEARTAAAAAALAREESEQG
jgi:hypothetical protein